MLSQLCTCSLVSQTAILETDGGVVFGSTFKHKHTDQEIYSALHLSIAERYIVPVSSEVPSCSQLSSCWVTSFFVEESLLSLML